MDSINEQILENSKVLLEIAKKSIDEQLSNRKYINKEDLLQRYPFLNENRATFVTLNLNGNLRGCIGSLLPQRSLLDDLLSNAKAAAFDDPRFHTLSTKEFKTVEIEISILTIPIELIYEDTNDLKSKIRIGEDGVILKSGMHQATFLPQVWEQLPNFEEFFSHLCQKAGLEVQCLELNPDIYTYKALKVK